MNRLQYWHLDPPLFYALLALVSVVPLLFQKRIRRWLHLDKSLPQE